VPQRFGGRVWCALTAFLLVWNGLAASFSGPFLFLQGYDGPQYQLLARNRLNGHTEVGDMAHTVRREGSHAMWRPGLVWVTQGLAYFTGSVALAGALASALGTTLMELALIWLALRSFGWATALVVFGCLVAPVSVGAHCLRLAVGQGPEPWATGAVLAGLAALVEALRRRSWGWAVLAGLAAGLSEWFRTGNLILFAVPCGVFILAALFRRDRLGWALPGTAVASFLALGALGGMLVPSRIDKTAANLWGNLAETQGPRVILHNREGDEFTHGFGGLVIAPGTNEATYDYIVRQAHHVKAKELFAEHSEEILGLYGERLGEVVFKAGSGLRSFTSNWMALAFFAQLLLSLIRRKREDVAALALGAGALAFYLGPCVLLRGNEATHYLLVMVPLVLLVGARGLVEVGKIAWETIRTRAPELAENLWQRRIVLTGFALAPVLGLTVSYYMEAIATLRGYQQEAADEMASLDSLNLEGKKIACRSMVWFVDRDVQTMLLPYATVPELANYARANRLDGILVWLDEPSLFFAASPYGPDPQDLDRALRHCRHFGKPRVAGSWKFYPVRPVLYARGKP
jgi:hypothetical protein